MGYVVVFLIIVRIVFIALSSTCVMIIALVAETILFPWLLVIGEKIDQAGMWRQFIIFKEFVRLQKKVESSSGNNIP